MAAGSVIVNFDVLKQLPAKGSSVIPRKLFEVASRISVVTQVQVVPHTYISRLLHRSKIVQGNDQKLKIVHVVRGAKYKLLIT